MTGILMRNLADNQLHFHTEPKQTLEKYPRYHSNVWYAAGLRRKSYLAADHLIDAHSTYSRAAVSAIFVT